MARPERLHDQLVGGRSGFAADRRLAADLDSLVRDAADADIMRANLRALEAFMTRTVRYLAADAGIRQFLNGGSGIAPDRSIHHMAQDVAPASRVVYTGTDPVVLAHAHTLQQTSTAEGVAAYVHGSLRRETDVVLQQVAATLDLTRPVAVLLYSYLNFVRDDQDPYGFVARLVDAVPAGSYLVLAHIVRDTDPSVADRLDRTVAHLNESGWPFVLRTGAEVTRFFDGLDLVEPGVVQIDHWRTEEDQPVTDTDIDTGTDTEPPVPVLGGVGRKL